jgi:RNA polymerase sigma-70 factor (ECF subfamily)
LFESGTTIGLSDYELVKRFAARRDEKDQGAEAAFAALVSRHGPMVFRVCRAVLGDRHEAEDAFQATFLVLASRARSIRSRDSVGSWLYGVALRVASRARSRAMRRKHHERRRAEMTETQVEDANASSTLDADLARLLHEEIAHLPEKFRAAVVLCYLEGLTHERAAGELGCPVGTIRSRLATARDRLKRRLTRQGIAPAIPPEWLALSLARVSESAPSTAVPGAVAECTIRGAMQVGLGKGALAGTVSAGAVALMEGVLANMMTTKLTIVAATLIVAGVVTAGAGVGVASYSSLGRDDGPAPTQASGPVLAQKAPQKEDAGAPPGPGPQSQPKGAFTLTQEARKDLQRRSEEEVKALIREYQEKEEAFRNAIPEARTAEARKALQDRRPNEASYAGALLQLAELDPGTPAAEEALIWIATHLVYGSMAERAKEMIVRDHILSDKLEPLFREVQNQMTGSKATEQLLREALVKNPDRTIRCLACYRLGHFLNGQASYVRLGRLFDPAQRKAAGAPIQKESWGYDYEARLNKLAPESLEQEAATLYERMIDEFGDIPLPHPFPRPTGDRLLPGRPVTFGDAARLYLHELRDLGIGRPAPEIEGGDLDGKPMRLGDYRGKVVLLYFCGPTQLSADGTGKPAQVTEAVRGVAVRHANEPIAVLGVATPSPGRAFERQAFAKLLQASGLPARFWWDQGPDEKPGPIQSAWNGRIDLYVIDSHGTIRYKHILVPELLEKAVTELLKERAGQEGRPRDKE